METEFFEPCDNLSEFCVGELARYRRRNDRVNLMFVIVFEQFDRVKNERLIGNCSERTLIYTRTAGNALIIVYSCRLLLIY